MNRPTDRQLRNSRLKLLLIVAVFATPFLAAWILAAGGWQPGARGNGEPILPQRNFAQEQVQVRLDDGRLWAWRDSEPRLTLVALAGPDCAVHCLKALTEMAKARVMLNRNQSRLRLLYLGAPPANAVAIAAMRNYWQLGTDVGHQLDVWRPAAPDSVGAVLVESDGTALSRYPDGFDASGLFRDLQKVVR